MGRFVAQSFAPALPLQRKLKKGAKFCGFPAMGDGDSSERRHC
jgi:hypothetical protein